MNGPRLDLLFSDVVLPDGMTRLRTSHRKTRGQGRDFASSSRRATLEISSTSKAGVPTVPLIAKAYERLQRAKAVRDALAQSP